jgi:hypothetical protein
LKVRVRQWIEDGQVKSSAKLSMSDKRKLIKKNLASLRDSIAWENVFNETVNFADKEVNDNEKVS